MIAFARIDNRLIHGQVIEAWLPHLDVARLLVADDEAAADPLTRMAMGLAVPDRIATDIEAIDAIDFARVEQAPERALLLLRDVGAAERARARGLHLRSLNLGNVHFAPGRVQITPSVFLSHEEVAALERLATEGVAVELRTLPRDRPLGITEIAARTER